MAHPHDMFKLALYAALHSAPDDDTKAQIQAIFDAHFGGGSTTQGAGGGTGQDGPPGR